MAKTLKLEATRYLFGENKEADQLICSCAADLLLCLSHYPSFVVVRSPVCVAPAVSFYVKRIRTFNVYIYDVVLCVKYTMLSILEAMKTFLNIF